MMYKNFIDVEALSALLRRPAPSEADFDKVMKATRENRPLSLKETALLLNAEDPRKVEAVFDRAKAMKKEVYGDRVVLFAPLYIGSQCVNRCAYCGFSRENTAMRRYTSTADDIRRQVKAMEAQGQKRSILVFGEHPDYDADFIARAARAVYSVSDEKGAIRRVNINAAPLSVEGFRTVKEAGIGTFQIFQESYNPSIYSLVHQSGPKTDYLNRLTALHRAQEAGIDDVGVGALFGLGDWRFEVLGLVAHAADLEKTFGVGPHTVSFPRLRPTSNPALQKVLPRPPYVSDNDFKRIIAILRLAIPYTGLILTAREEAGFRRECLSLGVSQIDAGTRLEVDGYTRQTEQQIDQEQFEIGDTRSLGEVIDELISDGHLPSFCTACYRAGRTGEHFMEFAKPGFIHQFCDPNGCLTLAEYLLDYAEKTTRVKGFRLIDAYLNGERGQIPKERRMALKRDLKAVKQGQRDIFR